MQIIVDANLVNCFHGGPSGKKKWSEKNLYLLMQFQKYEYKVVPWFWRKAQIHYCG